MARLRYNNALGRLGSPLAAGAGPDTIDFGTSPGFATLAAGDYIRLILDPPGGVTPNAQFEVVHLTAYTSGATTGTIARAQEGTTSKTHSAGAAWRCGPTALDAAFLTPNVRSASIGAGNTTIADPSVAGVTENYFTLTGNPTFVFPTPAAGTKFRLALQQDPTGGRTVTWPTGVRWPGGSAPVLSTAGSVTDIFDFVCLDGTHWLGLILGQNLYAVGRPTLTGTATVKGNNATSYNLTLPGTLIAGDLILIAVATTLSTYASGVPTGYTSRGTGHNGNNYNNFLALFSKVAVAGDIGATVTIPGLAVNSACVVVARTYTCGGIDSVSAFSGSTFAGATTKSPPYITSTQAFEAQVSFIAESAQYAGPAFSLNAGGTNGWTDGQAEVGAFGWEGLATEDFQIAGSGSTPSGGALASDGWNAAYEAVSVLLLPATL